MTILQAENLSFAFGHVALLDKASFQLAAGDKVGLIGRNGAGKSSLLKILAGVQKPDDGQLILQNGLKTVYVPQESFFDGAATVFDIVSEGLGSLRGVLRRYHEIGRELANAKRQPHQRIERTAKPNRSAKRLAVRCAGEPDHRRAGAA